MIYIVQLKQCIKRAYAPPYIPLFFVPFIFNLMYNEYVSKEIS